MIFIKDKSIFLSKKVKLVPEGENLILYFLGYFAITIPFDLKPSLNNYVKRILKCKGRKKFPSEFSKSVKNKSGNDFNIVFVNYNTLNIYEFIIIYLLNTKEPGISLVIKCSKFNYKRVLELIDFFKKELSKNF